MKEIEIKAHIDSATLTQLPSRAAALSFAETKRLKETDIYFNGNDHSFFKTDEALRLRQTVNLDGDGADTYITYKGPKLDKLTQSRDEIETSIGDFDSMRSILKKLGYPEVLTVEKTRRYFRARDITLCLDEVSELGCFLELETLIDTPSEPEKDAAIERLMNSLDQLGISKEQLTRKSYLELRMESLTS